MSAVEIVSLVYAACAFASVPFVMCVAVEAAIEERRKLSIFDAFTTLLFFVLWPIVFAAVISDVATVWRLYKGADKQAWHRRGERRY